MSEAQSKAPAELKAVAYWLRNKSGMKTKVGILNGARNDYFRGRSAVKALLSPAYAKLKKVPKITTEAEASEILHSLIPHTYYLRVQRGAAASPTSPKALQVNPQQTFIPDEYYAWYMDANQTKLYLSAVGMVLVVLAAVMFPLWPSPLRVGVWYLSIGLLGLIGLFFAIAIVRLIFWVGTLVFAKPGIWIFPNLFADVGFIDSFIPAYAWDLPVKKGKGSGKKSKKAAGKGGCCGDDHGGGHHGPQILELLPGEQ